MNKRYFISINKNPVFTCPHCYEYQSHIWHYIHGPFGTDPRVISSESKTVGEQHPFTDRLMGVIKSNCNSCDKATFWLESLNGSELQIYPKEIINYPQPHKDMPDKIRDIYIEAGSVLNISLGSSAALARLTLEKLLEHLGYHKGTLFDKIKNLEDNQDISSTLKQKLHIVRKIGNTGAHTGSISFEEKPDVPKHLMNIINDIVDELITKPKTLEELKSFIDN